MRTDNGLPRATVLETVAFLAEVFVPTVAKGPIIRRPRAVAMAERLQLDSRAVRRMQKLDDKHRAGPLLLRLPIRNQAVVLRPTDLRYVLNNSPEPFSPASSEKRAALAHFEPRNVLISRGRERTARRALQEQALDSHSHVHRLADSLLPIVRQEADQLLASVGERGELNWDVFIESWHRMVRRIIFGDGARDDHELTNMLAGLRKDANWAFLKPKRRKVRDQFLSRVQQRLQTAEPGSLAYIMRGMEAHSEAAPADQIPQWLFAFEPAGMATFRALALLVTHGEKSARVQQEIQDDTSGRQHLPYLRACVLESLRLWPTTPMILRQTTREVVWDDGTMPQDCGVLIFAPYFHRDDRHLPQAHSFLPEVWLTRNPDDADWPLVPFSDGPVYCPGRQLVLMLTSAMLSYLIEKRQFSLASSQHLSPRDPLPGTLNHFSLRFTAKPAGL
ncbi:cytochrome P450 [Arthrobacter sp.]|uniref:cytochrome P450 n=1 Tax=Arthrobacter sp. TaxID=1667 RepID=UPI00281201F4|nr:cytochrome P450 [Arthrobacter sp.]